MAMEAPYRLAPYIDLWPDKVPGTSRASTGVQEASPATSLARRVELVRAACHSQHMPQKPPSGTGSIPSVSMIPLPPALLAKQVSLLVLWMLLASFDA